MVRSLLSLSCFLSPCSPSCYHSESCFASFFCSLFS
jgi:hypothetical protein